MESTASTTLLLYSLVVLWFAAEGHPHDRALRRPGYRHKVGACFADMHNTLRAESVKAQVLSRVAERGSRKILKSLLLASQPAA